MAHLQYKTRGHTPPNGKARVYLSCHSSDFLRWGRAIISDLLECCDCAVFYYDGQEPVAIDETYFDDLKQFQLMVIPVTRTLLQKGGHTVETDLNFALEHNIPLLPILLDSNLLELYNVVFGQLQFLERDNTDGTAIAYKKKLADFMNAVVLKDSQILQIHAAFNSYAFLSYRKKDRKYAQDLMKRIHNTEGFDDIAIWYDEYLTPGENFNAVINAALDKSSVFLLTVTPNLLEPDNYVMRHEYPAARNAKKAVLPVKMQDLDIQALQACYEGIPACTDPQDPEQLQKDLQQCFKHCELGVKRDDPMHSYLLGLAYLNGVNVEVDTERALRLLKSAAFADLPEAVEKLAEMYTYGQGVAQDEATATAWRYRLKHIRLHNLRKKGLLFSVNRHDLYSVFKPEGLSLTADEVQQIYEFLLEGHALFDLFSRHSYIDLFHETYSGILPDSYLEDYMIRVATGGIHTKKAIHTLKKLLRNHPRAERRKILAQTYLRIHDLSYQKKGLRLYRKITKNDKDPQLQLLYAKYLLRNTDPLLDSKHQVVRNCWKVINICRQLTENCQHNEALRLMIEAVTMLPLNDVDLTKLGPLLEDMEHQARELYLYSRNQDDKLHLEDIYLALSRYYDKLDNSEKAKLYSDKYQALHDEPHSGSSVASSALQIYLSLAQEAEQAAQGKEFFSWDDGVADIAGNSRYDNIDTIQRILGLVRNASDKSIIYCNDPARFTIRCLHDAQRLWEEEALTGAGILWAKISAETENMERWDLSNAYYTLFDDLYLTWRKHTWLGLQPPPLQAFIHAMVIADRMGPSRDATSDSVSNDFLVTTVCLSALDAIESGNSTNALSDCTFALDTIRKPHFSCLRAPLPHLYEMIAFLLDDIPARKQYLLDAVQHRSRSREASDLLALAMDYSDLANICLQLGDVSQAVTYAERAVHVATNETKSKIGLTILTHASQQLADLLQPTEPNRALRLRLDSLENYLERYPDIQTLQQYVTIAVKERHCSRQAVSYAVMLVRMNDCIENRRYLCQLSNLASSEDLSSWFPFILRVQEMLVAQENTVQNRRYLAKTLYQSCYATAFTDASNNIADLRKNRLLRALQLLKQNDAPNEEDILLYNDIDYALYRFFPEDFDEGQAEDVQLRHIQDHPISPSKRLAAFADWSYLELCCGNKSARANFFTELSEAVNLSLEQGLTFYEISVARVNLSCGLNHVRSRQEKSILHDLLDRMTQAAIDSLAFISEEQLLEGCGVFSQECYDSSLSAAIVAALDYAYSITPAGATKEALSTRNFTFAEAYCRNKAYDMAQDIYLLEIIKLENAPYLDTFYTQCFHCVCSFLDAGRAEDAVFFLDKLMKKLLVQASIPDRDGSAAMYQYVSHMEDLFLYNCELPDDVFWKILQRYLADFECILDYLSSMQDTILNHCGTSTKNLYVAKYCRTTYQKFFPNADRHELFDIDNNIKKLRKKKFLQTLKKPFRSRGN